MSVVGSFGVFLWDVLVLVIIVGSVFGVLLWDVLAFVSIDGSVFSVFMVLASGGLGQSSEIEQDRDPRLSVEHS